MRCGKIQIGGNRVRKIMCFLGKALFFREEFDFDEARLFSEKGTLFLGKHERRAPGRLRICIFFMCLPEFDVSEVPGWRGCVRLQKLV